MTIPGIDIVLISRIEKSLQAKGFKARVFGTHEMAEQEARGNKAQGFAACFAAKEAFSKSIGTGMRGFAHNEVELLHHESGAPYISLSGNALKIAKEKNAKFSVSISHDGDYAIAIVLLEEIV